MALPIEFLLKLYVRARLHVKASLPISLILFELPVLGPSTGLQIVIGVHLAVEVSVVDCAITTVITADRHINDKVVRANKTKVHKLEIALRVATPCD